MSGSYSRTVMTAVTMVVMVTGNHGNCSSRSRVQFTVVVSPQTITDVVSDRQFTFLGEYPKGHMM